MAQDSESTSRSKQQRRRKPYRPIERADGVIMEHPRYSPKATSSSALPAVLQRLQPRSTKPVFEKHLFTLPPNGQNIWSKHQQSQHDHRSKRVHPAIAKALQHQAKCRSPPSDAGTHASNNCREDNLGHTESKGEHVPGNILNSHEICCIGTFASDLNDDRHDGTDSPVLQGRSGYNDVHSPEPTELNMSLYLNSDNNLDSHMRTTYSMQRFMEESGPWSTMELRFM